MTELPRWGQLTFTSFDDGRGPGGWQVKQTTGELTADELTQLRSNVQTNLRLVGELPAFPTADEISARPCRLEYVYNADGTARYWHTVPAGQDATRRPGNVFVHALLDRSTGSSPAARPIERWRSPGWLTPYGAGEVLLAELLEGDHPEPGPLQDVRRVVDFVVDPIEWRVGTLGPLLDGVAAALDGSATVVLGCADPDAAAQWIAAASRLMSPGDARRFSWTTFERAEGVQAALRRGVALVAVPLEDLGEVADANTGAIVIDTGEAIGLGELGGAPHTTRAGSTIPVTPWSVLAEALFSHEELAVSVLNRVDELAASARTSDAKPEWAMAAAMSTMQRQFDDVSELVQATLLAGPSVDTALAPGLAERVADHVRTHIGNDVARAWDYLTTASTDASFASAFRTYLRLALQSPEWLVEPGRPRLPAAVRWSKVETASLRAEFESALDQRMALVREGVTVGHVVDAVQVLDFGMHARMVSDVEVAGLSGVTAVLYPAIAALLTSELAADFVSRLPPLKSELIVDAIRRDLDRKLTADFGRELPHLDEAAVLWLFPGGLPKVTLTELATAAESDDGLTLSPAYVAAVIATFVARRETDRPASWQTETALWLLLAYEDTSPYATQILDELGPTPLPAWAVQALVEVWGPNVPPGIVLPAVRDGDWAAVRDIVRIVRPFGALDSRWGSGRRFAAETKAVAAMRWRSGAAVPRRDRRWLEEVLATLSVSGPVDNGVGPAAVELHALAISAGPSAAFVSLAEDLQERSTPGPLVFGVKVQPVRNFHTDRIEDRGAVFDQAVPSPRPDDWRQAGWPHPPTGRTGPVPVDPSVWHRIEWECRRASTDDMVSAFLPSVRDGLLEADVVLAVALAAHPRSTVKVTRIFRDLVQLQHLRGRDDAAFVDQAAIAVIGAGLVQHDANGLERLVDKLGRAEFGSSEWNRRGSERNDWLKSARRIVKDYVASSKRGDDDKGRKLRPRH